MPRVGRVPPRRPLYVFFHASSFRVDSSQTLIEVPQLDDRDPSDASSPCSEDQEEIPEDGSVDPDWNAGEESSGHSYRSDVPNDIGLNPGRGLGRNIILSRFDNYPTRSTWKSFGKMVEDRCLSRDVTFLIPTPDQRPWTPPEGYIYASMNPSSPFSGCGFLYQSS